MDTKNIRVAVCQIQTTTDSELNIRKAIDYIHNCAIEHADIVVLPEIFNCPYDMDVVASYAIDDDHQLIQDLASLSRDYNLLLIAGTLPEKSAEKLYNTSYVFEDGKLLGKHRKYHLFNIDIPGKISFFESKTFTAGEEVTVLPTKYGPVGIAICFDVRFPEQFKMMAQRGAKMIFAPGAFNHVTGPMHWELTLRARAIDSQCYVVACSPALNESLSYKAWGHSTIIHPMGDVLQILGREEGILLQEIDLSEVERVRNELPLLKQTRLLG